MRILAIRGQNLASLAAEFEIDLTRDPFASSGFFAITGPTGPASQPSWMPYALLFMERFHALPLAARKAPPIQAANRYPSKMAVRYFAAVQAAGSRKSISSDRMMFATACAGQLSALATKPAVNFKMWTAC